MGAVRRLKKRGKFLRKWIFAWVSFFFLPRTKLLLFLSIRNRTIKIYYY